MEIDNDIIFVILNKLTRQELYPFLLVNKSISNYVWKKGIFPKIEKQLTICAKYGSIYFYNWLKSMYAKPDSINLVAFITQVALNKNFELVEYLIRHNYHLLNLINDRVIKYTKTTGDSEILKWFENEYDVIFPDRTKLFHAICEGNLDTFNKYIHKKNIVSDALFKRIPMHLSILKRYLEINSSRYMIDNLLSVCIRNRGSLESFEYLIKNTKHDNDRINKLFEVERYDLIDYTLKKYDIVSQIKLQTIFEKLENGRIGPLKYLIDNGFICNPKKDIMENLWLISANNYTINKPECIINYEFDNIKVKNTKFADILSKMYIWSCINEKNPKVLNGHCEGFKQHIQHCKIKLLMENFEILHKNDFIVDNICMYLARYGNIHYFEKAIQAGYHFNYSYYANSKRGRQNMIQYLSN